MKPDYVFVVGSFRSGTTLVSRILNSSEEISVCGETHYFGSMIKSGTQNRIKQLGDLSVDADVYKIVDHIYDWSIQGYWLWLRNHIDKAYFTQQLLETDRSDQAFFKLLMQLHSQGKPIMGEKTPAHLYSVPTLLEWYPNARIVHTFRDPRAIFVSELRKKDQPKFANTLHKRLQRVRPSYVLYILLQVSITWLRAVQLHKRYLKLYPEKYYLIKFEDLVEEAEFQLHHLSKFLNVELNTDLLDIVVSNSSFNQRRGMSGIQPQAASHWRVHIAPWTDRWFQFWFGKELKEFGYR